MQVTKETLMGELLRADINTANILMAAGMHCVGCRLPRWNLWKRLVLYTASAASSL